jgi:dsDNA-binding SOS-regulon protein
MLYLVIRQRKTEYSEDYSVEKWSRTIKEANQYLSALSLLEDNEDVMFFIVPTKETPASEEVKKENGASEEIFF